LADWALQLRHQVQQHPQPVWLVAHSFGCLVSAVVAADVPERIGGVLLVAPADPARFSVLGRRSDPESPPAITTLLPQQRLGVGGMLISSSNDPWMSADAGQAWAARWQLAWRNIGPVGHINTDSGHGPWPQGLLLLQQLRRGGDGAQTSPPPGPARTAGRGGALARVRLETRRQLGLC
jgi:predicted alpha/beta hydrolase family esterase